ncbi:MAG TPA: FapA family protein, partial [Candidatus Acidoferrum sp.]|nr:FapA family protein [Candidatus Acidoferrum sp.]
MAETVQAVSRQRARVTISRDGMNAMLVMYPPQPGEPDLTADAVKAELAKAGVVYGIDEPLIATSIAEKTYNTPIKIASGIAAQKGASTEFAYHFDTSCHHSPRVDADGRVDFRDISFIQNTAAETVLVTKTPPTPGVAGTSVQGYEIPAPMGRDFPFKHGQNTRVSDDGLSLIATQSGVIMFLHGEVSVKDLMVITGDVDHSVGNIDCRGSVRVTGHIKAGFNVTLDGDLEVGGNVEDSSLNVKGNIMVKGGFFGDGNGTMHAGGDITVKFAEGQRIISGGNIFVGGELVNCRLIAKGNVWVKGKKGKIVGGEVRAGKEIRASVLGSDAGTATCLFVAYDHELMQKYMTAVKETNRLKADHERVKEALYGLYRLQMDGKLPPEKVAVLQKLDAFQKDIPKNLEELQREKTQIEEKMKEYRDARIVVEERIYPGVKAHFG